ncbi:hypothetical protein [Micromonospora sp. CNB394]|uniref:hypothetical protein n=1 Tax=Micromonospora sp. CNB394 TaxID=1169151 RepID=UPI00036613C5|nr:hypothetical protein [Micromonospora sp. CNB394]
MLRRCGLVEQRREGTRWPCRLRVDRLTGLRTWIDDGPFRFAFDDLFTFRDGLIARVDSYVVPLPGA